MYIASFHINKFGHFTNVNVEKLSPGLNIFIGNNEAGKTTCLEFLRGMLFGYIPEPKEEYPFYLNPATENGGSLVLIQPDQDKYPEKVIIKRIFGKKNELSIFSENKENLPPSILDDLFAGVNSDIYRNVFGFSLSELEKLSSLNAHKIQNALYGASFGKNIVSPQEVLAHLQNQKDGIFKSASTSDSINKAIDKFETLHADIHEKVNAISAIDTLADNLEQAETELQNLSDQKKILDKERRDLERRVTSWPLWDNLRNIKAELSQLPEISGYFPDDVINRYTLLQNTRDQQEQKLASHQDKLSHLQNRCREYKIDEKLLAALPELKRLAERKISYSQAYQKLPVQMEALERANQDLKNNLGQLGHDWNCDRIRSTDRSLFAREDMEKQAREMTASVAARQAAMDALNKANRDVEASENYIASIEASLARLPKVDAPLNQDEREMLRQTLSQLNDCRKNESKRENMVHTTQTVFKHEVEQLKLVISPGPDVKNETILKILDEIISKRKDALELADELEAHINEVKDAESEVDHEIRQSEEIKKKIETLRAEQVKNGGSSRSILEAKSKTLRELRDIVNRSQTEKEHLQELETRINSEIAPVRGKNWFLLICAIFFILTGISLFCANWIFGLTEIHFTPDFIMPINHWAAYASFICGIAFLAGAFPHQGPEIKRHKLQMEQLRSRYETAQSRLNELDAQIDNLCKQLGINDPNPIDLDALEMTLDRAREQCLTKEYAQKEIESLKNDYNIAKNKISELQEVAQAKAASVQLQRKRWHTLMQSLQFGSIPSPKSAATMFGNVEKAKMAYDNMRNAQIELDALWEDLHIYEESISNMPAIAKQLEEARDEAISLEDAVQLVLEGCKAADAVHEQKIRSEQELKSAKQEAKRHFAEQEEAANQLSAATERMNAARLNWSGIVNGLGLGDNLDPETVREAYKYMENCLASENKVKQISHDIQALKKEQNSLEFPLSQLINSMGQQFIKNSEGEIDWLATLTNIISDGEKNYERQLELNKIVDRISDEEMELSAEKVALDITNAKIKAIFEQAKVNNDQEFMRQANIHKKREDLETQLKSIENSLSLTAKPQSLDEFLQSFEQTKRDVQEARIEEIDNHIQEIDNKEKELSNYIGKQTGHIENLTKSRELADLRQEEAFLKTEIENLSLSWSEIALAEALLKEAKHNFEKERQPEVIRAASKIFEEITNGKWKAIKSSLDSNKLSIINKNDEEVEPFRLSRGTQEQAYLSLRLAYIQNHANQAHSLPIIMDEILVNFDAERAKRTVNALIQLEKANGKDSQQILYFTCHPHMLEIFQEVCPAAPVYKVENGNIHAS